MSRQADTSRSHYQVHLVDGPSLSDDQRAAAELRFRVALELALGGPDQVLPTLQAYMLVQSLNQDLPDDEDAGLQQQVMALWENAEAEAILAAFRPLGQNLGDARFEIVPL